MIHFNQVTKTYVRRGESVIALACERLTINHGEFVAVVGPSGSGKTTLLSLMGGMLSPTSGKVFIGDQSVYDMTVEDRAALRSGQMGFVFQSFNLVPYLTAWENVQLPLCLRRVDVSEQRDVAAEMLVKFGLGDRLQHKPAELSVGQQQRVALARTLVNNPKIILADEPTGNLDPASREVVLDALEACANEGRTIVMVTHDIVAARRANRTLSLREGNFTDDPEWLRRHAA